VSDFRTRLGAQLGAAAVALAREGARADLRTRPGAQQTVAAVTPPALLPRIPRVAAEGDFRARLGGQLAGAAARLAAAHAPAPVRSGAVRAPRARWALMPRVARLALAGVFGALAGAATASSVWLVAVGNPDGGTNPGITATPPPRAQLEALAVLRRGQSAADRGADVRTALEDVNDFTTGVRTSWVRVLESTPAGAVVLVPVARRDAGPPASAGGATQAIPNALCVYYPVSGASALGATPVCWRTAQLLSAHAVSASDGRVFGLAPDGVRSVAISVNGGPAVDAPVSGNFFDVAQGGAFTLGGASAPANPVVTFRR